MVRPVHSLGHSGLHNTGLKSAGTFSACWLAETVRLREAHWGPLDDSNEVRQVRAMRGGFAQKILLRAHLLGQRDGLERDLARWRRLAHLTLLAMLAAAVLAGAGAALGALGDGTRPVNLVLALTALLGLHVLTFLLWLPSCFFRDAGAAVWLGQVWLWITQKLARGPDAALAPAALVGLLGRNGGLRWIFGGISHGLWIGALLSAVLALLFALSARRYGFNWETTLLSADTFVALTRGLGWLPGLLGFTMPDDAMVRASNGLQPLPESAQALWSSWLIGCVVVYGLVPRLAGFALSLVAAQRKIAATTIDEHLPGYADLRERLEPSRQRMGVDAPPGEYVSTHPQASPPAATDGSGARSQSGGCGHLVVAGLELPGDLAWPPENLPALACDLGLVDGRQQRTDLLDHLYAQPPHKLLLACDRRQTPDRGTLSLITQAAVHAEQTHIVLLPRVAEHADARSAAWLERLAAAGVPASHVHTRMDTALAWLAAADGVPT